MILSRLTPISTRPVVRPLSDDSMTLATSPTPRPWSMAALVASSSNRVVVLIGTPRREKRFAMICSSVSVTSPADAALSPSIAVDANGIAWANLMATLAAFSPSMVQSLKARTAIAAASAPTAAFIDASRLPHVLAASAVRMSARRYFVWVPMAIATFAPNFVCALPALIIDSTSCLLALCVARMTLVARSWA